MRYLVRPPKVLAKRVLTAGDIVNTAPTAFTDVAGTFMSFHVAKDSVVEIVVEGTIQCSAAAQLGLDLLVDGARLGQTNGLKGIGVVAETAASDIPFQLHQVLDGLAEGAHSLALQVMASAGNTLIRAATTSNPLTITVLEHASVYPPS